MLDRYKRSRVESLRREYEHCGERLANVALAAFLSMAYDNFEQMNINRICANSNMSYQSAERVAEMFTEMFNMDVPAENFLPNAEKYTNNAIGYYCQYKDNRKRIEDFGYTGEDLDAFCKMVFYSSEKCGLGMFAAFNSIDYRRCIQSTYLYLIGNIDYGQFVGEMKIFIPPRSLEPMTEKQMKTFIKTMIRVVNTFKEVADKRIKRAVTAT